MFFFPFFSTLSYTNYQYIHKFLNGKTASIFFIYIYICFHYISIPKSDFETAYLDSLGFQTCSIVRFPATLLYDALILPQSAPLCLLFNYSNSLVFHCKTTQYFSPLMQKPRFPLICNWRKLAITFFVCMQIVYSSTV